MTHPADHATLPNFRRQRGAAALMTTLFLLIVVAMAVLVSLGMSGSDMSDSSSQHSSVSALFLAESGLERARRRFFDGTVCTSLGVDGPHNLGQGSFIVNSGVNTDFDGVTVLPVNQCRVQVTGRITATNVARTIEGVIQMGVKVQQGSFTKRTAGTGSQAITGIGFQPRAVIFFWTRQTATGFTAQNSRVNFGVGFATSSANERAVSVTARDRRGSSDDGRRRSETNAIIFLTDGGPPTLVAQAQLTSLDADGFTLDWNTINDTNAYIVHYIALGGDITNALASSFDLTNAGGNQSVAGLGFQPDLVLFLWGFTETVDVNTGNAEIGLGFAQSSTARAALVYAGRDGAGNNTEKRWQQRNTAAILLLTPNASPPNQDAIVDFVSMDADGFTLNKTVAPTGNRPIFYLALKGGSHAVGALSQPAATGLQATTGLGFQPQELILASFNLAATNNISGSGVLGSAGGFSLGAAQSATARGGVWFQDRSDNDPSDANTYTNTADVLTMAYGTANGNADGNPVETARADLSTFDSSGFTLNWTAANTTARQILYWAVGSGAPVVRWRE